MADLQRLQPPIRSKYIGQSQRSRIYCCCWNIRSAQKTCPIVPVEYPLTMFDGRNPAAISTDSQLLHGRESVYIAPFISGSIAAPAHAE